MKNVFRQTQLYKFLYYCNTTTNIGKNVLDCGAGGNCPPLVLFEEFGYIPHGIEISEFQLDEAHEYCEKNNIDLNIIKGDMRSLPYKDTSMSFAYSYNTIFHMSKSDISIAVAEIKRVLVPGGLCFINFLSLDNDEYGKGEKAGDGEFLQEEGGKKVLHTYCAEMDTDSFFDDMDVLYKETRVLHRIFEGRRIKQGYIDYIAQKQ
jgi:ubiquinone/menaquinone biosynthesis C-methylase UbiE